MYKGIKISNLICLIIGIIAFVILVTLATIMSYEYLSLLSKGSQSGDSSSGAAGWGMAFGIIFYLFSLIPLVAIILSSILFALMKKEISTTTLYVFGALLIPFGFVFNGIVILILTNQNSKKASLETK